ncbi:hypothetical protein HF519_04910 [Pseudonocardia bannensis]|uniref:Amidinotransferase n=1 Tax=Pseudonocardia bannensis TaxID=630973 RepID=A0A848DEC6_9PSEU|nr:hypothetical protein [Pseudonocardia bannensis]
MPRSFATAAPAERTATRRHHLMCPPTCFAVEYAINPWRAPAGFPRVTEPVFVDEGEGERRAHVEAARVLGRPVVTLELVDPRYHHLDTVIAVLDSTTIAYLPEAFTAASRAVLPAQAPRLAAALAGRGVVPVPVDVSELLKGGGGPECCTLEVRA